MSRRCARQFPILSETKEEVVGVPFDLPTQRHPLAEFVGMFQGDPWIKEWKRSMKAHRRKRDKHANKP